MADQPPIPDNPHVPHVDPHNHPELAARNARVGLILFFLYLFFYAGFIGITTFSFATMKKPVFAGMNLAVVYGFGLILGAIVLAILYMFLCRGTQTSERQ